ncbi:transcriptional regulator, partial [Vibrio parahaemolyticus]
GYSSSLTAETCTISHICQAANKSDPLATEVIQHVGRQIGKAIAISINLFNPEKVVIAGDITEAELVLIPAI